MQEKDPVTQFLARPENLAVALEIERQFASRGKTHAPVTDERLRLITSSSRNLEIAGAMAQRLKPIKNDLLETFWPALHSSLSGRLVSDGLSENWQTAVFKDKKWTRPYATCSISLKSDDSVPDAPVVAISIQQSASYNLNYGVARSEPKKNRPSLWILPEVKQIEKWLKHNKYVGGGIWWLGYRSDLNVLEDEFLLRMAGRYKTFVEFIAETVWELFLEVRPILQEADGALKRSVRSESE